MVKREMPAIAASRSIEEKPLPRAAMSFFSSSSRKPGNEAEAEPHGMPSPPDPLRGNERFERAIPGAEIDVGGADFDAVRARVAHELRRLIKTHRLAVEDGGAEHVRIAAFDPRRGVNQQRKARRVAFGKTVFAETFDLAEAMLGEARGHSRARPCR